MKKSSKEKVAGIILAAGASTRMGSPKQLLHIGGVSLLDHALKEALNSELDIIILVLGSRAGEIKKGLKTALQDKRLRIIENRNFMDGISSSIIAGLSEVEDSYDNCMMILADMPNITSALINRLLHQYLSSGLLLGAIKTGNKRSHPVIFGRKLYRELRQLKGDTGARDLFLKYPDQVCLVEPEEDYDDMDIDTPEDYLDLQRLKRDIPDISDPESR
ncbi:MAG: nucleotidyltransferase family protein [Deltaproteobacteria bacterium]|nr:nucleotidyltransferase family protein [Deltaproteobacteria bacterium]